MKKDVNAMVEKTLQVMQHRREVDTNPYLFTRIQARLEAASPQAVPRGLSWQWALGLALLLLNGLALWSQQAPGTDTTDALIEAIAADYDLNASFETYDLDY